MPRTQTVTHGELKDGDIIYNTGHEFVVTNLRKIPREDGKVTIRYNGVCTADDRNDSIRKTSYNGGTYGAFADINATIKARPN